MASRLRFSEQAAQDIESMMDYYESISPYLRDLFRHALYEKLDNLLLFPESGSEFRLEFRRLLVRRFSCWIYYFIEPEALAVVAVLHCSRDTKITESRLEQN